MHAKPGCAGGGFTISEMNPFPTCSRKRISVQRDKHDIPPVVALVSKSAVSNPTQGSRRSTCRDHDQMHSSECICSTPFHTAVDLIQCGPWVRLNGVPKGMIKSEGLFDFASTVRTSMSSAGHAGDELAMLLPATTCSDGVDPCCPGGGRGPISLPTRATRDTSASISRASTLTSSRMSGPVNPKLAI